MIKNEFDEFLIKLNKKHNVFQIENDTIDFAYKDQILSMLMGLNIQLGFIILLQTKQN